MSRARPSASWAGAILAAAVPLVWSAFGVVMFWVAAGGGSLPVVWLVFRESGWAAWLVLAAWSLSTPAVAGMLAAAARGVRVPCVLIVGFALLPWLVGVLGTSWSLSAVQTAVDSIAIDASQRALIIAQGISEASGNRLLGCIASLALCVSVAFGAGVAALARRAEAARLPGALIGAAAGVPLLALAAYASLGAFGATQFLSMLLPALVVVLGLALAGAAAGKDEPSARAAALSALAPVAGGLAIVAGAAAITVAGVRTILGVLGSVSPAERAELAAVGAEELARPFWVERWGFGVALVSASVLGAWALRNARPSAGRIAGALAVLVVAISMIALDAIARTRAAASLANVSRPPWHALADFSPIELEGMASSADAVALVRPEGIQPLHEDPIGFDALADSEPKQRLVSRWRARLTTHYADPDHPQEMLGLAIDARVDESALKHVFAMARAAGARSLAMIGTIPLDDSKSARFAAARRIPMLAPVVEPMPGSQVVRLEAAVDDDRGMQLTLGSETDPIRLEPRSGTGTPIELSSTPPSATAEGPRPRTNAYISLGPTANARSLARAAARLRAHGYAPVVLIEPRPALDGSPR